MKVISYNSLLKIMSDACNCAASYCAPIDTTGVSWEDWTDIDVNKALVKIAVLNFTLSNKASQYHNYLICKSMRESNRVLWLVTDWCEVMHLSGLK